MENLAVFSEKLKPPLLSKSKLKICLVISSIFCLFIIFGENGIAANRFQAGHDPALLYRTGFDLIHAFSGGNLNWSLFDLSNNTYISFGTIVYSIFSLPIAIIYFVIHWLIPAIPENELYRNVFIFTFFPLINICLTLGVYKWISSLKLNNFFISAFVIPLMVLISANEIWGFLLVSPSIAIMPYLFWGATLILQNKYRVGVSIFIIFSVVSFVQTPLLFSAYILPLPWTYLVLGGLFKFFNIFPENSNKKNISNKLFKLSRKYLSIFLTLISFFLITSVGKLSSIIINKPYRYENLPNLFGAENVGKYLITNLLPIFAIPFNSKIGIIFEITARFSYVLIMIFFLFLSYQGLSGNFQHNNNLTKQKLNNMLKKLSKITFQNKIITIGVILIFSYLLFEVGIVVFDLFNNYYTQAERLSGFYNISKLHIRGYTQEPLNQFFRQIFNADYNIMLNAHFGYFGIFPFILSLLGIVYSIFSLHKIRHLTIPLVAVLTLFMGLHLTPVPFCFAFFFLLSLIYPLAALGNNLSMTHYIMDYLTIPFICIGVTFLINQGYKYYLIFINKFNKYFLLQKEFIYLKKMPEFVVKLFNLNHFLLKVTIIFFTFIFALPELKKVKMFNSLNWHSTDKLKLQEGTLNNKRIKFINDAQNPLLKSSPLFTYKGLLPKVKGTHMPHIGGFNNIGTKQTHTGSYYKTLFLSRFMDVPHQYEVRHKSLVKDIWDIDNTCKIMPHEKWSLWYPNNTCDKVSVKPYNWPDYFINVKNKFDKQDIKIPYKISYLYSEIPKYIYECKSPKTYECNFINQIKIKIKSSDFLDPNNFIERKNSYSLKLPEYFSHLNTTIFTNSSQINLKNQYGKLMSPVQGYLVDDNSFDIGNIKVGYLTLSKNLINDFLKENSSSIDLKINSAPNVSLIRYTNQNEYIYFINTNKSNNILITTPYSNTLSILQNDNRIKVKETVKPIKGLVEFNSINNGISKIKISYKNHKLSSFSFILINIFITIIYLSFILISFKLKI